MSHPPSQLSHPCYLSKLSSVVDSLWFCRVATAKYPWNVKLLPSSLLSHPSLLSMLFEHSFRCGHILIKGKVLFCRGVTVTAVIPVIEMWSSILLPCCHILLLCYLSSTLLPKSGWNLSAVAEALHDAIQNKAHDVHSIMVHTHNITMI